MHQMVSISLYLFIDRRVKLSYGNHTSMTIIYEEILIVFCCFSFIINNCNNNNIFLFMNTVYIYLLYSIVV
jgi:hypothetical protein